jgi:hypothetical protein
MELVLKEVGINRIWGCRDIGILYILDYTLYTCILYLDGYMGYLSPVDLLLMDGYIGS